MEWNRHLIETKKNAEGPRGKPDIMYFNPELYDTESHGFGFEEDKANIMLHELELSNAIPDAVDEDFLELMNGVIPNWEIPKNVDSAVQLYANI